MDYNIKSKGKKTFSSGIYFLIVLVTLITITLGAFSQEVVIADTRSINEVPGDFINKVKFDFKYRTAVDVPGRDTYSTMMTLAPWWDSSGDKNHQLNFNNGGIYYRTGVPGAASWEGWQKLVIENSSGNVGIGITTPDSKLSVNGNIRAKEIKVEIANWPDYVFAKDYQLPTLEQTRHHIKEKGHLPGIPSAAEVKVNGIDLGEMNKNLLKKIEELTLYLIEIEKESIAQKIELENQQKQINTLMIKK